MKARPGPHSPRYHALLQLLRTADVVWNASRAFFAPWNLSPSQFNVLNLLVDHPQGLSQTELSRQLIMHRSNVTGLVDRLERQDLVHRRDAAADRRAYRVVLTTKGADLVRRILPHYYAAAETVWHKVSGHRVGTLTEELSAIARNAESIACALPQTLEGYEEGRT